MMSGTSVMLRNVWLRGCASAVVITTPTNSSMSYVSKYQRRLAIDFVGVVVMAKVVVPTPEGSGGGGGGCAGRSGIC